MATVLKQKAHQLAKKEIRRALQIWAEPHKTSLPGRTKAQLLKQGPIKEITFCYDQTR